jgi:formylglycine-generating enzyme required for sulfatase activity
MALCLSTQLCGTAAWAQTSGKEQTLLLDQVKTELQNGQNAEALSTAQQMVRKAPADYRSHYYLGLAYLGLQRYSEASAAAQASLDRAPANAQTAVKNLLAEIQKRSQGSGLAAQAEEAYKEGLNAKAARLFDQAWQASPQQPELGLRAATLYQDTLNQPLDAGRVLSQVAQAHPNTQLGKTAQERLAPLQPALNSQAQQWLAQARQQEPEQALQTLAKAQAIAPGLADIPLVRADIAARGNDLGVLKDAIKSLVRVKQATPDRLAPLPGMDRWLQQPELRQFLEDLLGADVAGQVQEFGKNLEQSNQRSGIEMVLIPGGSFQMGNNDGGAGEKPIHIVNVRSFALGKYEVTQGQWNAVMGNNPSKFSSCGDNCPVEQVSWGDVQQFIQKLNQQTRLQFRLPSEAEWEYAARAGSTGKWSFGNDEGALGQYAWFTGNSGKQTHPVGQKSPNAFGLYDMHGNVWEWVQDWYHDNYNGAPTNGSAWEHGGEQESRVLRGGSWLHDPNSLRSAIRKSLDPVYRYYLNGFRLARTVP